MNINVPTLLASAATSALTAGIVAAGFVNLQDASPGTPDTGHINVTGNVLAGRFGSGVNPTLARVQVKETGALQGVRAESGSGVAVFGKSTAASGLGAGGYFTSSSVGGRGIVGDALSGTGNTVGGLFYNRSTGGGVAVWGRAIGNGTATGVFGEVLSATGTALAATNSSAGNSLTAGTSTDSLRTVGDIPRHDYSANTPRPMVPLAYGLVAFDGTVFLSGSGNWSVAKPATGRYTITVTGQSITDEVVQVTPTNATGPTIATMGLVGSSNDINVFIWNTAGAAQDSAFHFVIYRQTGIVAPPASYPFSDLDETKVIRSNSERARHREFLNWQAQQTKQAAYTPPVDDAEPRRP